MLGSLTSIVVIWVITFVLVYEAVLRLVRQDHPDGKLMFIVSFIGLGFNLV